MKKKSHPLLVVLLWILFLTATGVIFYLSFQNGENAKALGKGVMEQATQRYYGHEGITGDELLHVTYLIRQYGRVLAFLVLGMIGTTTIHVSFHRQNWFLRTGITVVLLILIAVLTERLKIYIPSRHYSYEEMLLSIAAVMAGVVVVSVVTFTFSVMRGILRLIFKSAR